MLRSMTGFGAGDAENEKYRIHVEVKSFNQRYLDIDVHMPRLLNPFEEAMKKRVRVYASRGKMDLNVMFLDKRDRKKAIRVDKNLAIAYHKALNEMSDLLHLARPDDVCEIAAYPDVLAIEEIPDALEGVEELLLAALDMAMQRFIAMREAEGTNIEADFLQRLTLLEGYVEKIAALGPQIIEHYRERLHKVLQELLAEKEIDETRIIQETAIYADKINYTEEVVRLQSHCKQFRDILAAADAPVGRRLDFLVQEMNREINTTASKAGSTEAAQLSVDVKSEIEKLREQIQNIE